MNVAFAYTITGTHQGDFLGIAPTGKRISARGMQIGRFEGGQDRRAVGQFRRTRYPTPTWRVSGTGRHSLAKIQPQTTAE